MALNQYYKSITSDEAFSIISTEININGNVCEILDEYFNFVSEHKIINDNEFGSKIEDCGDIHQGKKQNMSAVN